MRIISWLADDLLAFQEELCSMEQKQNTLGFHADEISNQNTDRAILLRR